VMDNPSAHKAKKGRKLVEARGCQLLFLPPYSPDPNPLEEALSKVKANLRKVRARSCEVLVGALGVAGLRGHGPGRSRHLRTLRLPPTEPTDIPVAAGNCEVQRDRAVVIRLQFDCYYLHHLQ